MLFYLEIRLELTHNPNITLIVLNKRLNTFLFDEIRYFLTFSR